MLVQIKKQLRVLEDYMGFYQKKFIIKKYHFIDRNLLMRLVQNC